MSYLHFTFWTCVCCRETLRLDGYQTSNQATAVSQCSKWNSFSSIDREVKGKSLHQVRRTSTWHQIFFLMISPAQPSGERRTTWRGWWSAHQVQQQNFSSPDPADLRSVLSVWRHSDWPPPGGSLPTWFCWYLHRHSGKEKKNIKKMLLITSWLILSSLTTFCIKYCVKILKSAFL